MAKLDNVLSSVLNEIDFSLRTKVGSERQSLKENYFKSITDLSAKQKLVEKKKNKIEQLKMEIAQLETDIQNLDPSVSKEEAKLICKKNWVDLNDVPLAWGYYYSWYKKSELEVWIALMNTTAHHNLEAFRKIQQQVKAQFDLAIRPKEKQAIILWLQTSVDWKALWINIPNLFEINKVEVKGWKIIIDNALPAKIK